MATNWRVRFNGTDKTVIICAQTCDEAMAQASKDNPDFAVRSVQFHSASSLVATRREDNQHYANLIGIAAFS